MGACLPCSRTKARPDTALAAVVASCGAQVSQPVPPKSRPIKQDGYRLFVRREGSHATPPAATATLSHTVEKTTAFVMCVTGSSRIARLRALGLHLTQRGVPGDARVMFLRVRPETSGRIT
jgi:hypothetical protein